VGQDDNHPTGLTGATGALPIWIDLMSRLKLTPVAFAQPDNVVWQWLDSNSGQVSAEGCPGATYIPMLRNTLPTQATPCGQEKIDQMQALQYGSADPNAPAITPNNSATDAYGNPLIQPSAPVVPARNLTPPTHSTSALDRAMESF
jgi:penicillin-binding protein 1B